MLFASKFEIYLLKTDRTLEAFECGYGDKWKRSSGSMKLLMRKFLEEQMNKGKC